MALRERAGAGANRGITWLSSAVWVVPTCVDLALGGLKLPSGITSTQLGWVFVLLFVTLLPGFGEEFGWRGYLACR